MSSSVDKTALVVAGEEMWVDAETVKKAWDVGINGVSRVVEGSVGDAIFDLGDRCW